MAVAPWPLFRVFRGAFVIVRLRTPTLVIIRIMHVCFCFLLSIYFDRLRVAHQLLSTPPATQANLSFRQRQKAIRPTYTSSVGDA